jgi:hypothetical protein
MWDDDHIGYARPWPRSHEEGLTAANALYSSPKYWEDDKASSTSSKTSLTTRTQHMEISEEQLHAKPIKLHKIRDSSPHAERLLADYHKHLAQNDECRYIYEANQSKEDDHSPSDEQDTSSDLRRFGPRQTRQTTRMESFNYSSPGFPGDGDGTGSMSDDMIDASHDDKNDIGGPSQEPVETTSKPIKCSESATPRSTRRVPGSGTPAPTSGHHYDLRTLRPPTATEVSAAWPQLSAPGATFYYQGAATSTTATTSPRGAAFGACPGDM